MKRLKKRKKQKPETVKIGHAVVKIYPHRKKIEGRKKPYVTWQVADMTGDERRFRTFADHAAALREAERLAGLISSGQTTAAMMNNSEAEAYGLANEMLRPVGDRLLVAVERYVEAVKILGGGSRLIEAVESFVERDGFPKATVAEVVEKMLEAKKGKREERTIDDLRNRLAKFSEAFKCPIASVTHSEVQEWLDGLKTSERDRLNYRSKVNTLFRWAWQRNYVPTNPVEKTERPDPEESEIAIYTLDEMRRLIAAASVNFLPCLVIGAFAGLRSSEILRLNWEDVNFGRGFIVASSKKKGTPSRRLVPIQPNLASWLAPYADKKGLVWKGSGDHFSDAQQETSAATRVKADEKKQIAAQEPVAWKHNGLRHSFISYRLAVLQDDAKTALEAGNSKETIHAHYKELVTPEDAQVWFSIAPEKPANVLDIAMARAKP